jgi:hypothetical protein
MNTGPITSPIQMAGSRVHKTFFEFINLYVFKLSFAIKVLPFV